MRSTRWPHRRPRRRLAGAIVWLAVILVLTVIIGLFLPPPPELTGRARAVDGDTIRLADDRIRLVGIDAVELDQTCGADGATWPCGREARDFLADLLSKGDATCAIEGRDQYRRLLARCHLGGRDVGEAVVRAGWAVTDLEYAAALVDARGRKSGIWAGPFVDPAQWRRDNRAGEGGIWEWLMSLLGH